MMATNGRRQLYLAGAALALALLFVGLAGLISFGEALAALRWWLALVLLGLLAAPLGQQIFGRLADKGYAFSKMLALLVTGYLYWLLGSFGFLANNMGGAVFAVLLLA
ncbi:MAG: hypothetical protein KDE59_23715, partial [Anaerolineales bacterium]|nr:hypothetical protein [Anaerolineales bacterium]